MPMKLFEREYDWSDGPGFSLLWYTVLGAVTGFIFSFVRFVSVFSIYVPLVTHKHTQHKWTNVGHPLVYLFFSYFSFTVCLCSLSSVVSFAFMIREHCSFILIHYKTMRAHIHAITLPSRGGRCARNTKCYIALLYVTIAHSFHSFCDDIGLSGSRDTTRHCIAHSLCQWHVNVTLCSVRC